MKSNTLYSIHLSSQLANESNDSTRVQRRVQMDTSKLVTCGDEPRVPFLRCCPTSQHSNGPTGNRRSIIFLPISVFLSRLNIELSPVIMRLDCYFIPNVSPRATWYSTFCDSPVKTYTLAHTEGRVYDIEFKWFNRVHVCVRSTYKRWQ